MVLWSNENDEFQYDLEPNHINGNMRAILLNWAVDVMTKFHKRANYQTYHYVALSIEILDKYTKLKPIPKQQFQAFWCACANIATNKDIGYRDLVYVTDKNATESQLKNFEKDIEKVCADIIKPTHRTILYYAKKELARLVKIKNNSKVLFDAYILLTITPTMQNYFHGKSNNEIGNEIAQLVAYVHDPSNNEHFDEELINFSKKSIIEAKELVAKHMNPKYLNSPLIKFAETNESFHFEEIDYSIIPEEISTITNSQEPLDFISICESFDDMFTYKKFIGKGSYGEVSGYENLRGTELVVKKLGYDKDRTYDEWAKCKKDYIIYGKDGNTTLYKDAFVCDSSENPHVEYALSRFVRTFPSINFVNTFGYAPCDFSSNYKKGDMEKSGEFAYIFMDKCDGSLFSLIQKSDVTDEDKDILAIQLLHAICIMHSDENKFNHNDLHLGNVFYKKVDSDFFGDTQHLEFSLPKMDTILVPVHKIKYIVKIGDFGLAAKYSSPYIINTGIKDQSWVLNYFNKYYDLFLPFLSWMDTGSKTTPMIGKILSYILEVPILEDDEDDFERKIKAWWQYMKPLHKFMNTDQVVFYDKLFNETYLNISRMKRHINEGMLFKLFLVERDSSEARALERMWRYHRPGYLVDLESFNTDLTAFDCINLNFIHKRFDEINNN